MLTASAIHILGAAAAPEAVHQCPAEVDVIYAPGEAATPYVLCAQVSASHRVELHFTPAQKAVIFRTWSRRVRPKSQSDKEPEPVEREA